MENLIDLAKYPLTELANQAGIELIQKCRSELAQNGMFNLDGFLQQHKLKSIVAEISDQIESEAFTHKRAHNIYFEDHISDISANHPALKQCETVNHTICADQINQSALFKIYHWSPLTQFLALVMDKPSLPIYG